MRRKAWILATALIATVGIFIAKHGVHSGKDQSEQGERYDASMQAKVSDKDGIYNESGDSRAVKGRAGRSFAKSLEKLEEDNMDKVTKICTIIREDDADGFMSMIYHEYLDTAGFSMKKDGFRYFKESLGLCGPMEFLPTEVAKYSDYACYYGYAAKKKMHKNGEKGYDIASVRKTMIAVFDNGKVIPFPLTEINGNNIMLEKAGGPAKPNPDILEGAPKLEGQDDEDDIAGTR